MCRDERKGKWAINISTHVCSKHFMDDSEHEPGRKRERKTERKNRMLKPGASPMIVKCFSECLQPTPSKRKAPANHHLPSPKRRDSEVSTTYSGDTVGSHFSTDADVSDVYSDRTGQTLSNHVAVETD